ncbi:ead/Ea22-like family protein [Enterobacter asburiae]|uniref:ead/Ea22-like family protein n=1 Tax=Enterobacter asburiae TaxID=61645 RepID=UPI00237F1B4A|nr:ead/Ea22-like family protein [Enterobacter asburiae]MDE4034182.1 ead/Ea22-like family protein [Enterobacter asburiae]MDE4065696.1 ead/Ea22-like family protein [Enterobacter asburiae]MDE4070643.1 ead/Ea22-like family protein [Enterobacter asburiae]
MSNIDKRALREAAKAVGKNDWQYVYTSDLSAPGRGYITVGGAEAIYCLNRATGGVKQSENVLRYIAAARPEKMLALLDEMEAKDKQIDDLKATAAHSNAGWKEAHEQEARAEAAEKRIAELEAMQGKPVMFIDGDISSADADKLAAVIREFKEETETPAARMARIIRENPHPTNMCDMPSAGTGKGEAS